MLDVKKMKRLRKEAQDLKPLILIGKKGVTPATMKNIDRVLTDHQLLKIKYLEHKTNKKTLTAKIIEETCSILIEEIGNTIILFRENL